jgi:hypothetical protein
MLSGRVRRMWAGAILALGFGAVSVLGVAAQSGPPTSVDRLGPGSTFSFGLWGDMPYAKAGDGPKMTALVQSLNAAPIVFSVFDGDIKDGSSLCTDDQFDAATDRFNSLVTPLVYVPGDNEWTDCHRTNNGGYNNLERLAFLRQTMFKSADSFGKKQMPLEHQGPLGGLYVENTRWTVGDVVFVGLNVPGSNNNKINSPDECVYLSARTSDDCDADNVEYADRNAANIAWLQQSFQLARDRHALGLMLIMQADPSFDLPETFPTNERDLPAFDGYTDFLAALVAETQAFAGQVVLVHGDTHFFKVDKPLLDQAHLVPNFTRLETFGSPNIHWVRADVDPRNPVLFSFTPVLVPGN